MGSKYETPEGPSLEEMIAFAEKEYELQGELTQKAFDFFQSAMDQQQAAAQPVIDQQLYDMKKSSWTAEEEYQEWKWKGRPARDAAADALGNAGATEQTAWYRDALGQHASEVGQSPEELALREKLGDYGTSSQEKAFLANLGAYKDPAEVREAIDKLKGWDATSRIRESEGMAAQDVMASGEAARRAAMQELEAYGIDPSQVSRGALDRGIRAQTAAAASLASSQARRSTQREGLAADVEAANMAVASRMRELQMMGMSADEARLQADRELGYATMASDNIKRNRAEHLGYMGEASRVSEIADAKRLAGLQDAAALYMGIPQNTATALATSQGAGALAGSTAAQVTSSGMQGFQTLSGMRSNAFGALNSGYGTANAIWGNSIQAASQQGQGAAATGQAVGSVAGTVIGAYYGGPAGAAAGSQAGGQLGGAVGGMFNEGGRVPEHMSPSRGAIPDDVNARLTADEFVIPADAAREIGYGKLRKMVANARKEGGRPGALPV